MAGALAYHSRQTERTELLFQTHPGAYNDEALIGFVGELREHLRGDKVTLLWDGLSSHRSRRMRAFLATQRGWLVVARLPAYSPDLNPVEGMWSSLKGHDLANLCCDTLDAVVEASISGIQRIRRTHDLPAAFLRKAGLSL